MSNHNKVLAVFIAILSAAMSIFSTGCSMNTKKPAKVSLKTEKDSASYALGSQIGASIKKDGFDTLLVKDLFLKGIINGMLGEDKMPEDQRMTVIQNFMEKEMERQTAGLKEKGLKFLAENKKKPGIKTTESGLQYEVITEGKGAKPSSPTAIVKVHYKGMLTDGEVFDSSEGMDPVEFQLNKVIPGWTEGIQLMTVGSKYRFYIPADLAYGTQGQPQAGIGPHEVLIFEVELLGVK